MSVQFPTSALLSLQKLSFPDTVLWLYRSHSKVVIPWHCLVTLPLTFKSCHSLTLSCDSTAHIQKLSFPDTVLWLYRSHSKVVIPWHCLVTLPLTFSETVDWLSSFPLLMQKSFWCWLRGITKNKIKSLFLLKQTYISLHLELFWCVRKECSPMLTVYPLLPNPFLNTQLCEWCTLPAIYTSKTFRWWDSKTNTALH